MKSIDGADDSLQSDSTYPSDTGRFRVRGTRTRRWVIGGTIAVFLAGFALVHDRLGRQRRDAASAPSAPVNTQTARVQREQARATAKLDQCLRLRERVLGEPASPGTPDLDKRRVELLMRTKLEPVVFVRPPEYDHDVPKSIQGFQKTFQNTKYPSSLVGTLSKAFRIHPLMGRQTLLRDGYLYADDPERAFALVHNLRAEHLFDQERIWIQRGDRTLYARRMPGGKYTYTDGPLEGREVSLVLFDRVGSGPLPPPLHRDLRSLRYRLHFDRLQLVHVTPREIVADLRYGGLVIPSVLKSSGARLELECEAVPSGAARDLALYRKRAKQKLAVVQALRRTMREEIEEKLPFDEPYREWGQQDGVLRYKWRDAYLAGKGRFELNGDTYYVYASGGQPKIPQVCVDFLTDTLERTSGTWWSPLGANPRRIVGKLDFDTLNNTTLRRVPDFLELARAKWEWFDVYDVPPEEQIPFWRHEEFADYLLKNADRFVPGDIVLIRGYANFEEKWKRPIMHYHSFFIYESDPVTGFPIAIVGNAGVPALRVWNTEARRTPRRAIWHRIRPQLHWLESIIEVPAQLDERPAPLALGWD